jgi:hypothetical protein
LEEAVDLSSDRLLLLLLMMMMMMMYFMKAKEVTKQ